MKSEAFENVKNQIGCCGIYCGGCLGGNGAVIELTRRYEELVKKGNLETWVPKDFDFKEFMKGLASIQKMPQCPGCRKGGGPSTCKIRICALGKSFTDCNECDQLISCKNFEELEHSMPKIKEDLMKIKNANRKELLAKWMNELEIKWPHCVILCEIPEKRSTIKT